MVVALGVMAFGQSAVPSASNPAVRAVLDELVLANRILAQQGVLDAYGHVSVRSPVDPTHFFLARSGPAALVTVEDIIEYDLDSKPVTQTAYAGFSERFIHAQIYKARADVKSVVHHHAPEVVSFSVSGVPLRAVAHMAAFLGDGTGVFDTRPLAKNGDMLIGSDGMGAALATALGAKPAILLRGHGAVVVAEGLHVVVGRAYYMSSNARELAQALSLGGKVTYLSAEETRQMGAQDGFERAWTLWKAEAQR